MELLDTLVVGGYLYTTAFGGWLYKQIQRMRTNHMKHMENDIRDIKEFIGMPDDSTKARG